MALVGRLFVIFFAIILSSIVAGLAIAVGLFAPQWHAATGDLVGRILFWGTVIFATGATASASLLPAAVLIAVAEAAKVRSFVVYAVAGTLLLLGVYYNAGPDPRRYEESIDRAPPPMTHQIEIFAAAGAVFGMAYWLIAGRNAGRWREPVARLRVDSGEPRERRAG